MNLPLISNDSAYQTLVKRRHPTYAETLPHWTFCQSTYEGGREWFKQNVHRYLKEGDREFRDRLTRAYRFNHTREVVNLLTKYVFKEGITRNLEDAPDCVQKFWSSATLTGGRIDTLMRAAASQSSVTGCCWLVTDTTAENDVVISRADAGSDRTYVYIVKPQDMLDFSYGEDGKLNWTLFRVMHRDDTDPMDSSGQVMNRYVLWTRNSYAVLQEVPSPNTPGFVSALPEPKLQLVSHGINEIGEVPVVQLMHTDTDKIFSPPGLVDDTSYLDRACANYLSNLDAIIQDQTFSQLVMPSSAMNSGVDADDGNKALIEMGTKRIFTYNSDAGTPPTYISPDASQAQLIISVVQKIINEIYHSVGMAGERTKQDNSMGIDNSSGVAKAYDFDRLNALLAAKAERLENAENALVRLVCLWNGETPPDELDDDAALVAYPENYDVRGLPDEFDIAQNLMLVQAPDSVRRQQMTGMLPKLFARLPEALRSEMLKELESWPIDPVQQAQEMMAIAGTGNGPPKATITSNSGGSSPGAAPTPSSNVKGTKAPSKSTQGQNNKK